MKTTITIIGIFGWITFALGTQQSWAEGALLRPLSADEKYQGPVSDTKQLHEIEKKQEKVTVNIDWFMPKKRRHIQLQSVLEIENASFKYPWSKEQFEGVLDRRDCLGMVAEYNGIIVGYLIFKLLEDGLEVLNLAVHPEWRHRGIATQLVDRLKKFSGLDLKATNGLRFMFQRKISMRSYCSGRWDLGPFKLCTISTAICQEMPILWYSLHIGKEPRGL